MELVLTRQVIVGQATIGTLELDGKFECHTLEDVERAKKIHGKTAIPPGTYNVTLAETPNSRNATSRRAAAAHPAPA
ncbi:MAG: hypothetical protein JWR10_2233 [Rubritepida sp.]|nr:hypothetical protein [Rubritepida sp.]